MRSQIVCVGRHEGLLRDVAKGCAWGDCESIRKAAIILSAFVKRNACIVPMPSHIGWATTMLRLCKEIRRIRRDIRVCDCLVCVPHESSHAVKSECGVPPPIHVGTSGRDIPLDNAVIIDNTVCTGATASAALDALPNAIVLAITKG